MRSKYRLTEKNVEELNLVEVDWETVKKHDLTEVFIRAHEDTPTYGPYLVDNVDKRIVCTLEGTDLRRYPRDKGLFVRASDLPGSGLSFYTEDSLTVAAVAVIEELTEDIKEEIDIIEGYLESLYSKQEGLRLVLKALTE